MQGILWGGFLWNFQCVWGVIISNYTYYMYVYLHVFIYTYFSPTVITGGLNIYNQPSLWWQIWFLIIHFTSIVSPRKMIPSMVEISRQIFMFHSLNFWRVILCVNKVFMDIGIPCFRARIPVENCYNGHIKWSHYTAEKCESENCMIFFWN